MGWDEPLDPEPFFEGHVGELPPRVADPDEVSKMREHLPPTDSLFEALEQSLAEIPDEAYDDNPDGRYAPAPRYTDLARSLTNLDADVYTLRRAGYDIEQIAKMVGATTHNIEKRIRRVVARLHPADTLDVQRQIEAARLDMATVRLSEIIETRGNTKDDDRAIRAIEKFVQVSARRAALLNLDLENQPITYVDGRSVTFTGLARQELLHRKPEEIEAGDWDDNDPAITAGLPGSIAALSEYTNVIDGKIAEAAERGADEDDK